LAGAGATEELGASLMLDSWSELTAVVLDGPGSWVRPGVATTKEATGSLEVTGDIAVAGISALGGS